MGKALGVEEARRRLVEASGSQFDPQVVDALFWTLVGAFLHYTLPQTDIVRVVNTYEERQELGDWTRIFWATPDDQSQTLISRDVQFIGSRRQ